MKRTSFWVLVLKGLVGRHRTVQLQLLQHYWLEHRLGLLWYWMVCLGNEQRSFCHFWDCIQLNSNTLVTSCEESTHWKRPWCWDWLGAWGEGDDRGWDGWMASLIRWTWVWVNSRSWSWTGRPGVLWLGLQRVGHDWATELNCTEHLKSEPGDSLM